VLASRGEAERLVFLRRESPRCPRFGNQSVPSAGRLAVPVSRSMPSTACRLGLSALRSAPLRFSDLAGLGLANAALSGARSAAAQLRSYADCSCADPRMRPDTGLLDAFPDQVGASTTRRGSSAVSQLVAGDGEGPLLRGAVPIGIGAGLDVERECLVL